MEGWHMPAELNSDNYDAETNDPSVPVMVDFWGPQCGPCLALSPFVDELEERYRGKIKIGKLNASENKRLCLRLRVLNLPTFLFYKGGREAARLTGEVKAQDIEKSLRALLEE
jgi:thioredoxin 1